MTLRMTRARRARIRIGAAVLARIAVWRHLMRSRRALGRLEKGMLRDIGVTQEVADREAQKPFWRG